ncbi:MAG: hypothetical protein L6Q71_08695, partial [Planctomycetes bacterium]|nr:hypothetical protein [Planctomycetota bacterium]
IERMARNVLIKQKAFASKRSSKGIVRASAKDISVEEDRASRIQTYVESVTQGDPEIKRLVYALMQDRLVLDEFFGHLNEAFETIEQSAAMFRQVATMAQGMLANIRSLQFAEVHGNDIQRAEEIVHAVKNMIERSGHADPSAISSGRSK